MTLIPLISALVTQPERAAAPAGALRGGYDPGAGHRPLAAAIAVGVPLMLVAAVALSPMVIDLPPKAEPQEWTSIALPKPTPPEPQPDAKPQPERRATPIVAIPTPLPPVSRDAPDAAVLPPYTPPVGSGSGPVVAEDPPVPPPLVPARLDTRYAGAFQPDYPASEQRRGVEGAAKVRVLIGTDGRVKAVEMISADSPGFFEETKQRALSKWRFKPATRGGVAEESWQVMTVRFRLANA